MGKRTTHPPKDKKQNKPRKEKVVPLSEMDRRFKAAQEFTKSLIHLGETEKLAEWRQAPNACVHSAYYAMYHTATAVILTAGVLESVVMHLRATSILLSTSAKLLRGSGLTLIVWALSSIGRGRTGWFRITALSKVLMTTMRLTSLNAQQALLKLAGRLGVLRRAGASWI